MIGEKLTEVLGEIEDQILDFTITYPNLHTNFTDEGFRSSLHIFMSALMSKSWDLMEKENMPMEDREEMASKVGYDLRKLIKTYTDIDTHQLYNVS